MNVGFFHSREIFDEVQYKKASGEDRYYAADLPIMLTTVGTVSFYLIRK